jgi:hypothetical protein
MDDELAICCRVTMRLPGGSRVTRDWPLRRTDIDENAHNRTLWNKTSDHPRRHASCRLCRDGGCGVKRRGLGIITGLTQRTPKDLAREIARCHEMTDQPFGVNLTFLPSFAKPPYVYPSVSSTASSPTSNSTMSQWNSPGLWRTALRSRWP